MGSRVPGLLPGGRQSTNESGTPSGHVYLTNSFLMPPQLRHRVRKLRNLPGGRCPSGFARGHPPGTSPGCERNNWAVRPAIPAASGTCLPPDSTSRSRLHNARDHSGKAALILAFSDSFDPGMADRLRETTPRHADRFHRFAAAPRRPHSARRDGRACRGAYTFRLRSCPTPVEAVCWDRRC